MALALSQGWLRRWVFISPLDRALPTLPLPPLGHLIPATWVLGLFWKTVEPSGGGAWPGEVGHW